MYIRLCLALVALAALVGTSAPSLATPEKVPLYPLGVRTGRARVDAVLQAVQKRMAAKRTSRLEQERHEYLFAGLLRCARCGSPMIGQRRPSDSGVVVAYRCEAATSQRRCTARAHRESAIEAALEKALNSGKIKSLAAGRMGLGTSQVGDLVAGLV